MRTLLDDIDLLKFAGKLESASLGHPRAWTDEVKHLAENGEQPTGDCLPWMKTHDTVRFRDSEVTLWGGVNGSGKSLLVGQVLLFLPSDIPILIASLEMPPAQTIVRMARQSAGQIAITDRYIDEFMELTDNFWIYDQLDTVDPNRILGLIHYAAQEYGIKHFMIDALVKCGIAPDDYAGQSAFADRLCWAAKTEKVHIHLVHHIRKGEREGAMPDKFSIKGAGELTDLVDNVAIVHRCRDKERKVAAGESVDRFEPDLILRWAKQRHFSWEGDINLYWHGSGQFRGGPDSMAMRWH